MSERLSIKLGKDMGRSSGTDDELRFVAQPKK